MRLLVCGSMKWGSPNPHKRHKKAHERSEILFIHILYIVFGGLCEVVFILVETHRLRWR